MIAEDKNTLTANYVVYPNNTLEITDVSTADTGQYTCRVTRPSPWGPIQQHHAVEVLRTLVHQIVHPKENFNIFILPYPILFIPDFRSSKAEHDANGGTGSRAGERSDHFLFRTGASQA